MKFDKDYYYNQAMEERNLEKMAELIQQGADINNLKASKMPSIIYAISKKDIDMIRFLIIGGVNLECFETRGFNFQKEKDLTIINPIKEILKLDNEEHDLTKTLIERAKNENSITLYEMIHIAIKEHNDEELKNISKKR